MYLAKILSSEMSGLLGKRHRQPSSPSNGRSSGRSSGNSSRRSANRATNQTTEEPVDIDDINPDSAPAIVDLTQVEETEIVDLTSLDNSVVYLENDSRSRHQRAMRPSQRVNQLHNSVIECSSDDDDDSNDENEIQVLPVINIGTHTKRYDRHAASSSTGTSSSSSGDSLSPKRVITCPICMDDEKQIKANNRQLMSTVCGHIFCNKCIRGAVQTQHKCPTCRKKLSMRQFHPIFL